MLYHCARTLAQIGDSLDDAEEVDVGVVDGEVGDDQAGAAVDPEQFLIFKKHYIVILFGSSSFWRLLADIDQFNGQFVFTFRVTSSIKKASLGSMNGLHKLATIIKTRIQN